jgi:hypothetical protein
VRGNAEGKLGNRGSTAVSFGRRCGSRESGRHGRGIMGSCGRVVPRLKVELTHGPRMSGGERGDGYRFGIRLDGSC